MQIFNVFASFTRPNNTTAYATGQLVANSTTAGSVVPMSMTMGNSFPMPSFRTTRARLSKSGTSVANASFRIMLYQGAAPTVTNGDGGAFLSTGAANWLGNIDVTSMIAFSDGAAGTGSFPAGSEGFIKFNNNGQLYALLMAQGAYTPAANEVFTLVIEEVDDF